MSDEQTPPPRAKQSGCVGCFIMGLALIGIAIILISVGAIILISVGASVLFDIWNLSEGGADSVAIGKPMPGLELMPITLNENPVSLADLQGKVTLLNFWATWCGPCRAELPEIAEIGEEYEDNEDFLLLPVSCGQDNLAQLSTDSILMLRDMELEIPCYSDPTGETQQALAVITESPQMSLPTTLVLDRKGIVRGVWVGFGPGQGEQMQKRIAKLLAEKPEK